MRSPEIISFNNGVIEWVADAGASFFVLEINGKRVSDRADGSYGKTTFPLAKLTVSSVIEIAAADKQGAVTRLFYDVDKGTLCFLPVSAKAEGETLVWNAVGGAACYKVYDTDFNAVTVRGTEYDMSGKNPICCVCPVSARGSRVLSAEPVAGGIKYLEGEGTEIHPFVIKTPFDLRTVDYYELCGAECGVNKNVYELGNDIDFGDVATFDGESNIYALKKPFFGVLDGKGHKLYGMRVNHDGGYFALFDCIAPSGTVKNLIIENADIVNRTRNGMHPINASTAAVAYVNNGVVQNVVLRSSRLTSSGGGVAGLVVHNYGTVTDCEAACSLVQDATADIGGASYEMAGVVLENCKGGVVSANRITALNIRGTGGNVRSAAGAVSVNREGGRVERNEFSSVCISGAARESEYGGIVAYNAGEMSGNIAVGTLTVDGAHITEFTGDSIGRLVGKDESADVGEA